MIGLRNLFGIGSVTLTDDTGDMQMLQVTERTAGHGIADRIMDKVRRVAEFGFASVPPIGSEALVARRNGERSQSMVIGTNHRASRPRNLQPGDTCLYDVRGAKVQLTENGLLIDCAGLPAVLQNCPTVTVTATEKILLDAPLTECTGNFKADKLLTGDGTPIELGALRDAYNAHKHTGVSTGSGTSGGTDHTV